MNGSDLQQITISLCVILTDLEEKMLLFTKIISRLHLHHFYKTCLQYIVSNYCYRYASYLLSSFKRKNKSVFNSFEEVMYNYDETPHECETL